MLKYKIGEFLYKHKVGKKIKQNLQKTNHLKL